MTGAASALALVVVGPTATGKSALAMELARQDPGLEIVSADAMQVYRGMDVGTAKPTCADRAEVPHHLLDVADPGEEYTVARYQRDARAALVDVAARGRRAVLVGGTGLYVRAVVDDLRIPPRFPEVAAELDAEPDTGELHRRLTTLDPVAAGRMEPSNRRRVLRALEVTVGSGRPFSSYGPGLAEYPRRPVAQVGLALPRPELDRRIEVRYDHQLAAGFLDEVRELARVPLSRTARQALGYKELFDYLEGRCGLGESLELARRRTRRFARRQERWLRRDPRVRWVDATASPMALAGRLLGEFLRCA